MLLICALIVFTDKKHSRPIPALVRCEGRNRGTGISLSVRIAAGWRGVPRDREGNLAPWPAAGGGSLTAGGAAGGSGVPPHSWHRLDPAAGGAPEPYAPGTSFEGGNER